VCARRLLVTRRDDDERRPLLDGSGLEPQEIVVHRPAEAAARIPEEDDGVALDQRRQRDRLSVQERPAQVRHRTADGEAGRRLTPAETRIAELVARGLTNREVAGELVVAVHTVEAALTRIYDKLEVRSRSELTRVFADRPGASA
ncbi:MAG: helix-turn-helix transcriptional regulator, partial [Gaiellaceae bacterium]